MTPVCSCGRGSGCDAYRFALLDQQHLLRDRLIIEDQRVEVKATGQISGVEIKLMFAGRHLLVGKHADLLSVQVAHRKRDIIGHWQAELDRGCGVEGIGVVLRQLQALGQDRIIHS